MKIIRSFRLIIWTFCITYILGAIMLIFYLSDRFGGGGGGHLKAVIPALPGSNSDSNNNDDNGEDGDIELTNKKEIDNIIRSIERSKQLMRSSKVSGKTSSNVPSNSAAATVKSRNASLHFAVLEPDNFFVLSAYLDLRKRQNEDDYSKPLAPFIRVLALVRSGYNSALSHCIINDDQSTATKEKKKQQKKRKIETVAYEFNENHGQEFGGYVYSCALPRIDDIYRADKKLLETVKLYSESSKKSIEMPLSVVGPLQAAGNEAGSSKRDQEVWRAHNFTVCVPPLTGTKPAAYLMQFVEMAALLGATQFIFYDYLNDNAKETLEMRKLLQRYSNLSDNPHRQQEKEKQQEKQKQSGIPPITLHHHRWNLPIGAHQVWYFGQMLAIHHCLYKSMGSTRYTVFHDLDEMLVPRGGVVTSSNEPITGWNELMRNHVDPPGSKHCGYRFFSAFFPPSSSSTSSAADFSSGAATSDSMYFRLTRRISSLSRFRTKCVVRPELIFEQGIHHISKQNVERMSPKNVHERLAVLHHYRQCDGMFGQDCSESVTDASLQPYKTELLRRIALRNAQFD